MKYCRVWGCPAEPVTPTSDSTSDPTNGQTDAVVLPKALVDAAVNAAVDAAFENVVRSTKQASHEAEPATRPATRPHKVKKHRTAKLSERPEVVETPVFADGKDLTQPLWVALGLAFLLLLVFVWSVNQRVAALEAWLHGRLTA